MSARFSPRRRAYHRTSFISADASRLDAVHVVLHIQHIQAILASTPCTPEDFYALAKASRLDAVRFLLDIQHTQTLLASTPCISQHIIQICGRFPPRRCALYAPYPRYTNASGLGTVHIATHPTHLRTLVASTPWMFCFISNIYKRFWPRRRACRNTSYTSADAAPSMPSTLCSVCNIYKRFWRWRRARRNTSRDRHYWGHIVSVPAHIVADLEDHTVQFFSPTSLGGYECSA